MTDTGWQPIETAPNDHKPKLLLDGHVISIGARTDDGSYRCAAGEWLGYNANGQPVYVIPTHWMPLPSPPLKEKDDV